MRPARSEGWSLMLALGGLILWAGCFASLYGALSLGCAMGLGALTITLLLAGIWAAHLALLAWLFHRFRRARRPGGPILFLFRLTSAAALVGLVSTLWIGWPLLALPPCS